MRSLISLFSAFLMLLPTGLMTAPPSSTSHKKLIRRSIPAVVMIVRTRRNYGSRGMGRRTGTGSGVVVHPAGYILTNFHNMGSTRTGQVLYQLYAYFVNPSRPYDAPKKRAYRLKIINTNYKFDLALMKIEAVQRGRRFVKIRKGRRFPYLRPADSSKVEPTDTHYALGFPAVARINRRIFSGITVLNGKVVGLDRRTKWIKSNAEISPGNSGGPSIDLQGRVIGINSVVKVDRRTSGRISFIRPINIAKHLAKGTPAFKMFPKGKTYRVDRRRRKRRRYNDNRRDDNYRNRNDRNGRREDDRRDGGGEDEGEGESDLGKSNDNTDAEDPEDI